MKIPVTLPSPGESISEVQLAQWLISDGQYVEKEMEIAEVDSEKATLTITAPEAGVISLQAQNGDTLPIGYVIAMIDSEAEGTAYEAPVVTEKQVEIKPDTSIISEEKQTELKETHSLNVSPLARRMMEMESLTEEEFINTIKHMRFGKEDIVEVLNSKIKPIAKAESSVVGRHEVKTPMSMLRKKIAERLVSVKNSSAMLTTFNEVDMSAVMHLRAKHAKEFAEVHGVKLSYMSFFTLAVSLALKEFPMVNSRIDEDDIVSPDYQDVGIAVSTPKGLMVPVLRNVQSMSLPDIEKNIALAATKARSGKLSPEDMSGGTFTITNGGVFGSMLSTPIINPPQSGILGMHNIVERPIVKDGQIVVAPIMYVALSYDHRIIDGRDSVGFLAAVKKYIENPNAMLNPGKELGALLLDL